MLTDIFVRDKTDGSVHRVGSDRHDSIDVRDGVVHYYNLQNGEGTGECGDYEFVDSEYGAIDEQQLSDFICLLDKLKPCPFCGGEAVLKDWKVAWENGATIKCMSCGKAISESVERGNGWRDRTVAEWNTRARFEAVKQSNT